MVWIIDSNINKVRQIAAGSQSMLEASSIFMSEAEAVAAHKFLCKHPTRLANSKTRQVSCADCNKTL